MNDKSCPDRNYYYICDDDFHNVRPVDLLTWGKWFQEIGLRRRVDRTETERGAVSTVFLGLDHRFGMDGPPLLFETMIFADNYDCNQDEVRAATVEEARENHARLVEQLAQAKRVEPE